jgi:hypothetical protein
MRGCAADNGTSAISRMFDHEQHVAGRDATADRCIFVPAPPVKNEETGNLAR